ncbi:histidinol-phosphate transaminase [Alicyclobacillus shizuokensis]|uniref:histidinol-phosphate transaminase n=1 Tax=Alicyclobacillus shizuokensis TaxID=392014 RepID=UPI0008364008|nr:histidinol-phosphate transaminase [Alicyclobacillus shizuokensis]
MLQVAERVRPGLDKIQPYVPGLTDDDIKRMFGVQRVVKLNANENALGPSPKALQAIAAEISSLHLYPDGGSGFLRQAIAQFHGVGEEHVLAGNGSDDIIKLLAETFLEPGDEVVVPTPSFSQYGFGAAIMGARQVTVSLKRDFTYDVEALRAAVGPHTKIVYVCSPNNPTGTLFTAEQAEWLLDSLPEHVLLVFDLAYNDYSENPARVRETPRLLVDPRVIILHTFSKLYGLAGLRIGYGLAHPDVWRFVHRVREPFNVNRMAQRAAAAALADEEHRQKSREHAARCREFFRFAAADLGLEMVPSEANFVFIRTGDGMATVRALMAHGVLVRAGFSGAEEYIRVTFGKEEDNRAFHHAMQAVLAESRKTAP